MHWALLGAGAFTLGAVTYSMVNSRFPEGTVKDMAIRWGVTIVIGGAAGLVVNAL